MLVDFKGELKLHLQLTQVTVRQQVLQPCTWKQKWCPHESLILSPYLPRAWNARAREELWGKKKVFINFKRNFKEHQLPSLCSPFCTKVSLTMKKAKHSMTRIILKNQTASKLILSISYTSELDVQGMETQSGHPRMHYQGAIQRMHTWKSVFSGTQGTVMSLQGLYS